MKNRDLGRVSTGPPNLPWSPPEILTALVYNLPSCLDRSKYRGMQLIACPDFPFNNEGMALMAIISSMKQCNEIISTNYTLFQGLINFGVAENALCDDILTKKVIEKFGYSST